MSVPPPAPFEALPVAQQVVIETRGLRRIFGRGASVQRALAGIDLSIFHGEVVLLFGHSGSGKTTLLNVVGGLDRTFEGEVRLFGKSIRNLSERRLAQLRARSVGFVFQDFHLVEHLSVLDNVATPNLFSVAPLPRRQERERARDTLDRVGLAMRADSLPTELSGGQRQRVAVARALFGDPELLLCDEPTGNLDARTAADLVDLLGRLHAELGTTLVVATHELGLCALPHRRLDLVNGLLADPQTAAGEPD